jgi:hypothetical protein
VAGSFQASGGSFSSVAADTVDGGACSTNPCNSTFTGGSGTFAVDPTYGSTNGRWTGTLSLGSQTNFDVAIYAVSGNEALVATTDQLSASQPILGGEAITTASAFNNGSLANSHIVHIGGLSAGGPDVSIGVLSFDGVDAITGTVYEDQAGTVGTTSVSGVYQVAPNSGRTTFTAAQGQTLGSHTFVAYLIPPPAGLTRTNCVVPASCVTGFLVGTDSAGESGEMEFETSAIAPPPPFVNLFVTGNFQYGTDEALDPITPNLEGDVYASATSTSASAGSLGSNNSFAQDVSYGDTSYYCASSLCYLLQPNQIMSGSYSVNTNGTGTFGGGTVSVTNGNVLFYIDESPVNLHPSVIIVEQ